MFSAVLCMTPCNMCWKHRSAPACLVLTVLTLSLVEMTSTMGLCKEECTNIWNPQLLQLCRVTQVPRGRWQPALTPMDLLISSCLSLFCSLVRELLPWPWCTKKLPARWAQRSRQAGRKWNESFHALATAIWSRRGIFWEGRPLLWQKERRDSLSLLFLWQTDGCSVGTQENPLPSG